jgi:ferritin
MNAEMEKALNEQVNAEMYSFYLYLSMSAWADSKGLKGLTNWMRVQAQEEMAHGMKIFDFINERGGKAILKTIEEPPREWQNIINVFEEVLAHERKITASINELYNIAMQVKDHASSTFLHWFVIEQVEEEANVSQILDQLRLIDGQGTGLFLLDREFGQRIFVDPTKKQA